MAAAWSGARVSTSSGLRESRSRPEPPAIPGWFKVTFSALVIALLVGASAELTLIAIRNERNTLEWEVAKRGKALLFILEFPVCLPLQSGRTRTAETPAALLSSVAEPGPMAEMLEDEIGL